MSIQRFLVLPPGNYERLFVNICVFLCWLRMIDEKVQCKRVMENVVTYHERKHNIVHYLHLPMDESFFLHYFFESWFSKDLAFIDAPIFVQSLVSPHKTKAAPTGVPI
ncbi:hypothetical protein Hanom_Chr02g00175931 [Helianthus anomalus]